MKRNITSLLLLAAALGSACSAFAGTIWDGEGGATTNIDTAANWDGNVTNALNGTTAATFGTGGSNATINVNASFTGITINRTVAFTISNGSGNLTVGTGGITTSSAVTHVISESSLILGGNQTWNIGSNQLDVTGVISGASRSITKNGTGTLRLTGANSFTGGLTVNEGILLAQTNANALGGNSTGTVKLGSASAGTNNVTLALGTSGTFNNPITVQSGNSGTVTIHNFGGYSPSLAAQITLNKGLILNNNDGSAPFTTLTVSGNITGGSGLTITGSNIGGQTILSNVANNYTGATAVNSGTLRLTGNLGNTAVTVASGAGIAGEGSIGAAGNLTLSSGASLTADGGSSAALTVGGDLTLSGLTDVTLEGGLPATTGNGTVIPLLNYNGTLNAGGATFALQNPTNYRGYSFASATATPNQVNMTIDTKSLTWSGANGTWDINNSTNWDGGTEKFYQGDAVTFDDSGTTKAVTLGVSVIPASVTFNNSSGNDYSLSGAGVIAGAAALTKTGTGNVTISTANTYTGGTTISGGKVVAAVANALGTGAVTNNAVLDLTAPDAGTVTYTGLSNALSGNGTVNVTLGTGGNTTAVNGNYSGFTGTWNIGVGAATGAGKVQMTGADNALANINVLQNGTLYVNANVTKNATVTLYGGDTGESLGQLRLESGANWAGNVILAGDITGSGDFTVGSNTGGGNISGNISETGGARALSKGGASTLTLSGSNSYTGLTTISAGTLKLGSAGALGNGTINTSGVNVNGSSIFDLGGISPTAIVSMTLNSTASGNDVGSLHNSAGGTTSTFGGAVTLQAATVMIGGGASGAGGNITLTGAITGNGKNINKNGLGTFALSNSGTVALGTLQVNRGVIRVDSGTTLNATSLDIGTGNSVGGSLILNGGNVTSSGTARFGQGSGSASGTLTLNGGTLTVPALTKGTLTFNANFNGGTLKASSDNATFFAAATSAKVQAGGAIIDDGGFTITVAQPLSHDTALDTPTVTPDGGLTKLGSGNLTLTGNSTFTGTTRVLAGTLVLGSSLAIQSSALDTSNSITGNATAGLKTTAGTALTLGGLTGNKTLESVFTTTSGGYSGVTTLTLNPGAGANNDYSAVIANGGMALNKTGLGTQTLSGVNTYTGGTTVTAGVLSPTLATALPEYTTGGKIVFNGGIVSAKIGDGTATGWSTAQVDDLLTNATKTSGAIGIDTTNGDLTQWTAFTTTNLGPSLGLAKLGANTLTLNQTNTYTGVTTVSAGTLAYGASEAIAPGAVTVNGATAVLDLGASHTGTVGTVTVDGGGSITGTGTSALTSTGTFEMKSGSVSAILAGSGIALNKTTSGTVTLSGANIYTGNTTISGGTLNITGTNPGGGSYAVGAASANATLTINSSGTVAASGLTLTAATSPSYVVNFNAGIFSVGAGGINATANNGSINFAGGTLQSSAAFNISGSIPININTGGAVIDTTGGNITSASAFLVGTGGGVTVQGGNKLTLPASNSVSGGITITGSGTTLAFSTNSNVASSVTVNSGANFDLSNFNQSVVGLAGAGTVLNTGGATTVKTLTIAGTGGNDFSGNIAPTGGATELANTRVVINLTSGIQTFSGSGNTYAGTTTLSAGTLLLAHETTLASATGTVNVSGGTLATNLASATLGGNLTLSSGSLSANSTGVGTFSLTSGNSFSMSGGTWVLSIADPVTFDKITATGSPAFTITGGTIDLSGSALSAGGYQVLSGFGSGSVSSLGYTGYDAGLWTVSLDTAGLLNVTAIPEPGTWVLVGIGLAFLLYRKPGRRFDP